MRRPSSLWLGVCAALVSGCGSGPTQPATPSAVSSGLYTVPTLSLGTYTVTVPVLSASKTATLTSAQPNVTVNFP
jgi:hypothetical protein